MHALCLPCMPRLLCRHRVQCAGNGCCACLLVLCCGVLQPAPREAHRKVVCLIECQCLTDC